MSINLYTFFTLFVLISKNFVYGVDPANDPNNIERPCPDFDLECIRDFFTCYSEVGFPLGEVPEPLLLDHYRIEIANSNMSVDLNLVTVEGLNGKIVEFYTNSETQKLVLAMRVESLNFQTPEAIVTYHRVSQESIVRSDKADFSFGPMIFTIEFPSICDLHLNEAQVFTYVENSHPKFNIGSKITATSDSTAQQELDKVFSSLKEDLREAFMIQGKIFMFNYIQYVIADFGLDNSNPCNCDC